MTPLLPPLALDCPAAHGAIYHHGAHVVDWTPRGGAPVLWMSQYTHLDSESAIRGGIPICWPWFGAGLRGVESPLHGIARLEEWRLVRRETTGDTARATYLLIDARPDKCAFPYRLTYDVSVGREFSAMLTVRNTGSRRFDFEEALHTYLAVADVRQIRIAGLDQAMYLDRAAGHAVGPHRQEGDITITEETDRIYHSAGPIEIADPVGHRTITIERTGSADAVVWNPWIDKARAMPDFGDDEWMTMICVETANVGEHVVTLNPGKDHTMGFTLRLAELG